MTAHGDALRARRAAGLHHVDLGARGIDADAEAGERAVPDHPVAVRRKGLHGALRDRALRRFTHYESSAPAARPDVGADAGAHPGGRHALGLARKVGVAGGALDVGMTQELADHREALAGGERPARVGVPQVVDAHVVEPRAGAQAIPLLRDGGETGARLPCRR